MEPVRRSGGLCYSYVVHEPRLRTMSREVQETHYEPDVDKIKVGLLSVEDQEGEDQVCLLGSSGFLASLMRSTVLRTLSRGSRRRTTSPMSPRSRWV